VAAFESALRTLVRCEGKPVPLQLSGGEPTLHRELTKLVGSARGLGFRKIEVNTNGLALARDSGLCEALREAGLTGVYLQLDGLTAEISEAIRGRDLVAEKARAIENARRAGLEVVLAVTVVPGINDESMWELVRFGVQQRLTGVNFQPIARTGRFFPSAGSDRERFGVGTFVRQLARQSGGELTACDLSPIPCSDPRCGAMAYVLVCGDRLVPLNRLLSEQELSGYVADMSDWAQLVGAIDFRKAGGCGCSSPTASGALLADSRLPNENIGFFSIGFHGMMDVHTFDLTRARRCCVHALTIDGRLIPLCVYNVKHRDVLEATGVVDELPGGC
jgi:uncharacterized radical SAM superfamily Fe-S cluster-containing enzyme